MAKVVKNVVFKLDYDAKGAKKGAKDYESAAGGVEKSNKGLESSFKKIATVAAAAFAINAIKNFAKETLRLAEIQKQAEAKVAQAIKGTAGAAGKSLEELKKIAVALQKDTLFGDEEILNGATAQLLTFTNIAGEQFERTQAVALDLATVLDGDLQSASIQLGKALNDPVANLSALSRSGIQFSTDQKKVIKELATTNRLAEAQTVILDELERQYGGQAKAAADASDGTVQLANAFGDLKEGIGVLIGGAIGPTIDGLQSMVEAFSDLIEPQSEAISKLEETQTALQGLVIEAQLAEEGTERRRKAIEKLDEIYPGFLKNLNTETVSNSELAIRLQAVNNEIVKRIVLERKKADIQNAAEDVADAAITTMDKESKVQELLNIAVAKRGIILDDSLPITERATQASKLLREEYARLSGEGKATNKTFAQYEGLARKISTANFTLRKLTKSQSGEQSVLNELQTEYAEILTKLNLEFGELEPEQDNFIQRLIAAQVAAQNLAKEIGPKDDPKFLTGSLAFLKKEISDLQKEIDENTILGSDEAVEKTKRLARMVDDLAHKIFDFQLIVDGFEFDTEDIEAKGVDFGIKFSEGMLKGTAGQAKHVTKVMKDLTDDAKAKVAEEEAIALEKKQNLFGALMFGADAGRQLIDIGTQVSNVVTSNALKDIDKRESAALEAAGDNAEKRAKIEKKFDMERQKIEKAAFARGKALQISTAIINGAQAVLATLAAVPGPVDIVTLGALRIAQIALVGVTTAAQIGVIAGEKFAEGGLVEGGQAGKDSVPAWLMPGERVMTTARTREYGPVLQAIHEGKISANTLNDIAVGNGGMGFSDLGIIGASDRQTKKLAGLLQENNKLLKNQGGYSKYFA